MISVIIPIYNSEKYLRQCLESVKNQTYQDFEILCIDDGSTDSSKEIIKNYQKEDSRFLYFYQKHSNAGVARNLGLTYASGNYVMFLDSDDFLEKTILEELIKITNYKKTDIVIFQYKLFYNSTSKVSHMAYGIHCKRQKDFCLKDMKSGRFQFTNISVWNKFYNAEFIRNHNLHFKSHPSINDLFFSWTALMHAKIITLHRCVGIYYRINTGISISDNLTRTEGYFLKALSEINEYAKENNYWEEYRNDLICKEKEQASEFLNRLKKKGYTELAQTFEHNMKNFFSKY